MSLLVVIKKGAKVVDGLLDDAAEVAPKRSRKKVADMTSEEHEAHKAWQRQQNMERKLAADPDYVPRSSPKRLLSPEEQRAMDDARRARDAARKRAARLDPEKGAKMRQQSRESVARHKDQRAEDNRIYREKNAGALKEKRDAKYQDSEYRVRVQQQQREYHERNKEARLAANRAQRAKRKAEDPEGEARRQREAHERYKAKDPVRWRAGKSAAGAKRRTRAVTPPHANVDQINEIHQIASEIRGLTQMPWEVDHVIPYQGKAVTGFNHPDNLLILPRAENRSKGARFEPGDLPPRAGIRNARALLKKLRAEHGITE